MNAPANAVQLAAPKVELLALTAITPSETHIQSLRRARFNKEGLKELAESIAKLGGVLQPIVVRPLLEARGAAKYEIVAGERRWLATKQAGLAHIQVTVRELTDEQVLEVQLIENLQREGPARARGGRGLRRADEAEEDQRRAASPHGRQEPQLRLCAHSSCSRSAPRRARPSTPASSTPRAALLIARIGHHDTQRQAMKASPPANTARADSYREAHEHMVRDFMLKLNRALQHQRRPLVPKAGLHHLPEAHRQPARPLRRREECRRLHRPEMLRARSATRTWRPSSRRSRPRARR
jgi:ParB/RepB/Spo0J family partition protein